MFKKVALIVSLSVLIFLPEHIVAQVTTGQLTKALEACEQDLDSCRAKLAGSSQALKSTQDQYEKVIGMYDSLVSNYQNRLQIQDSITLLLKTNSDTLEVMISDYGKKIGEVDKLYQKELQRESRPWFFTSKGWQGLLYGALAGVAVSAVLMYSR